MTSQPRILVTNDDGIEAPGLAALAEALAPLGEVRVLAPAREWSATSHCVSVGREHELRPHHREDRLLGHSFDGSPADCVKFALTVWLDKPPSLVVSGINPGPNTGINVLYSGTVAAAVEAAILGVPAMAVSLARLPDGSVPEYGAAGLVARRFARLILSGGLEPAVALNVNVPASPLGQWRGVRVAPQGRIRIRDSFTPIEPAPDGVPRFTNWGDGSTDETLDGLTDKIALRQGYVAVTPLSCDLTAHHAMDAWRARLDRHSLADEIEAGGAPS